MKTPWAFAFMFLAVLLAAEMQFTQRNTIPVAGDEFSYAEIKSYQDEDRILVYSQTAEEVVITVCDLEGNTIENHAIAMSDSTLERKMSCFEHGGTPYLVMNKVITDPKEYDEDDWEQIRHYCVDIFNLDDGERIFPHISAQ